MVSLQVLYPPGFAGTWQVTAELKDVAFPFGQQLLNKQVPGVTKASMIAALPDVGAAQDAKLTYSVRFVHTDGAAVPDRCVSPSLLPCQHWAWWGEKGTLVVA